MQMYTLVGEGFDFLYCLWTMEAACRLDKQIVKSAEF